MVRSNSRPSNGNFRPPSCDYPTALLQPRLLLKRACVLSASNTSLTELLKRGAVKLEAVHRRLVDLPVAGVDNGAVLIAHDQAAAVGDGVRDAHSLDPDTGRRRGEGEEGEEEARWEVQLCNGGKGRRQANGVETSRC